MFKSKHYLSLPFAKCKLQINHYTKLFTFVLHCVFFQTVWSAEFFWAVQARKWFFSSMHPLMSWSITLTLESFSTISTRKQIFSTVRRSFKTCKVVWRQVLSRRIESKIIMAVAKWGRLADVKIFIRTLIHSLHFFKHFRSRGFGSVIQFYMPMKGLRLRKSLFAGSTSERVFHLQIHSDDFTLKFVEQLNIFQNKPN